jgi:hypothetical protein
MYKSLTMMHPVHNPASRRSAAPIDRFAVFQAVRLKVHDGRRA